MEMKKSKQIRKMTFSFFHSEPIRKLNSLFTGAVGAENGSASLTLTKL
jgi:hypothetical protein